jgi:hypothetical protein
MIKTNLTPHKQILSKSIEINKISIISFTPYYTLLGVFQIMTLHTSLLTPRNIILEKLTGSQILKKIPEF